MNKPFVQLVLEILVLLMLIPCSTSAGNKPVIVSHDESYSDRAVRFHVVWQSENPVMMVRIFTGKDQKEIKIDEYDNRRTRDGYSGEVSTIVELQHAFMDDVLAFVIQLEDDVRLKSDQVTGKVQIAKVKIGQPIGPFGQPMGQPIGQPMGQPLGQPMGQPMGTFGQPMGQPIGQTKGATVEVLDKLIGVMDSYDMIPNLSNVIINRVGTDGISISTRATDDKALREVNFKIFDATGNLVQTDSVSTTGKFWEGTSKIFNLANGNYKAVIQAVDAAGNTSKEKTEFFSITGSSLTTQPQAQ